MAIATINPATGQVLKTFDPLPPAEIEARLAASVTGFATLRRTSFGQRAEWLRSAADLLDKEQVEVATMMTTEMGKTLASARAEATKCAAGMRFFAAHAERFLADEEIDPSDVGAIRAYVRYRPLGPLLAVMPWNFPLWQVIRFAAPALMAGNVALLKHSSNVPQTALYLEDLFRRAGLPPGGFQTLLVGSDQVPQLIADPRIRAVSLTGSDAAGRSVAKAAGAVLKKAVLELGGSDPFIVMPSAALDRAAAVAVTARCQNNGQSCIAAKRFLVHTDVYDSFVSAFVASMSAQVVGDPMDDGTDIGPLATEAGRDGVEEQVRDAVAKGATVLCGGQRPDRAGWYYPPTVLTDINPSMRVFAEEVFGPVASVYRVDSYAQAIELANATPYGLGSDPWTNDAAEAERFIEDLDAGMVFVNGMTVSYPDLPFGGVKSSGYGRELWVHGIREFCNIKTVWIGDAPNESTGTKTE
jgi:succinate-semialdehyde dehydrogenase/glutarate-semialdehyde dehydrogenase